MQIPSDTATNLHVVSKAACDQVKSIDKQRLIKKLGSVSDDVLEKIKEALRYHFDL